MSEDKFVMFIGIGVFWFCTIVWVYLYYNYSKKMKKTDKVDHIEIKVPKSIGTLNLYGPGGSGGHGGSSQLPVHHNCRSTLIPLIGHRYAYYDVGAERIRIYKKQWNRLKDPSKYVYLGEL